MSTATAFRAAVGAAVVFLIIAIAAFINHFTSHTAHPLFGAKLGIILLLAALACGIWANYNRPARQV